MRIDSILFVKLVISESILRTSCAVGMSNIDTADLGKGSVGLDCELGVLVSGEIGFEFGVVGSCVISAGAVVAALAGAESEPRVPVQSILTLPLLTERQSRSPCPPRVP